MKQNSKQNILNNVNLKTVNPDFKGNIYKSGVFIDEFNRKHPSRLEFIRHGLTLNPQKREKAIDRYQAELIACNDFFDRKKDQIIWLGHSSFFICLEGINILVDPIFFDLPFYKRKVGLPCLPKEFKFIDYILISHNHRDHCDLKTLQILINNNPNVILLTGLKMSKTLNRLKKVKIQEAGWFQRYITTPKINIVFTPAKHWARRYLFDMNRSLWGSFYIQTNTRSIFYAGDTAYSEHFSMINDKMGAPDISILPIGTYKPEYIMKESHLDPEEAFSAFIETGAKLFIPMHYGTYDLSNEPLGEPIRRIENIFIESNDLERLKMLRVGEKYCFTHV